MPIITKEYKFCAAHRYWNQNWTDEKNQKIFGDDIRLHGHNYVLEVSVAGKINPESGFIISLQQLNELVEEHVINILDHSQIEKDIEHFHKIQPSTENLVVFIWDALAEKIPQPARLFSIKLQETPTIYTEYFGPNHHD